MINQNFKKEILKTIEVSKETAKNNIYRFYVSCIIYYLYMHCLYSIRSR